MVSSMFSPGLSNVGKFKMQDLTEGEKTSVLKGQPATLETFANLLRERKKVVVLVGAGVSVSAGIPDFRSPDIGLYQQLSKYNLPFPEAVFLGAYFETDPRPFFHLVRELYPSELHPTLTHYFLKLLDSKGQLLRVYSQNIDSLEVLAGLSLDKIEYAHGSFATATCVKCKAKYDVEWLTAQIFSKTNQASTAKDPTGEYDPASVVLPKCARESCQGLVRPDVVLFGESLPSSFFSHVSKDANEADFLLVMGTSLEVQPVNKIPAMVSPLCPRLLANRDYVFRAPSSNRSGLFTGSDLESWGFRWGNEDNYRDLFEKGDCDITVVKLCDLLGWTEDLFDMYAKAKGLSIDEAKKKYDYSK